MFLSECIEDYLLAIGGGSHSKSTQKLYRSILADLLEAVGDLPLEEVRTRVLRRWQNGIAGRVEAGELSVYTLHQRVRSVQTFFRWCVAESDVPLAVSPAENLKPPRLPTNKPPKNISDDDLARILSAAYQSERDYAIIRFLADTNCRVSGLIGLTLGDLDLAGMSATVVEKGHKARPVYFNLGTRLALERWLIVRPRAEYDHIFLSHYQKPLTRFALNKLLSRLGKRAGVTGPHNPHAFRHAWARRALEAGMDLGRVSRLMGHATIAITHDHYALWSDDDLAKAHREFDTMAALEEAF